MTAGEVTSGVQPASAASRPATGATSLTRRLLRCGAVAGPLFILVVLVQDYTRPGVDPRTQALSLLSLGPLGGVQMVNFALAGVLNLLYAVGLWRTLHPGRGGTWGPLLIGAYGVGLVTVGVFRTDPANGYPPGVPAATHPSWHGAIHALGGLFVFVTLAAALIVLSRAFRAGPQRGWATYCLASATAILVVFFGGFTQPALAARTLRLGVLIGWMAASLVAIALLNASSDPSAGER